jgi:diadenylate cyclase
MNPLDILVVFRDSLSWRAMLDICLIAAGMFFLYRTLRHLGTWKIVTGILAALVVYLLARLLDLKGIEWIFGNLGQVAVIGLIVIFQPELRKLFERAASMRRTIKSKRGQGLAQTIAQALDQIAGRQQGAIVVLPGKEPIGQWLSGGFSLDARASVPLLLSIFDPNSPGHDGAVIVDDGRVTLFGVRLPVSANPILPEEFGTRHYAALGLAEKTDALVLTVSEERGTISVFTRAGYRPLTDHTAIADIIRTHWDAMAHFPLRLPSGRPRWLLATQLVTSLVVAAVFWSTLIIARTEPVEKFLNGSLEFIAVPPNLVLVDTQDDVVRLHLAGPKANLDALSTALLSVKLDLSKAVPGEQSFVITRDNLSLPKGVSLLDASPARVEITLAEIQERVVSIRPQLLGRLPDGLKIQRMILKPEKVRISAPPRANPNKAESLITTPIYLDSIDRTTTVFCKIIAPASFQPVNKRWPDVEVTIEVKPASS